MPLESVKVGPNDALSQNFMKLRLLVTSENVNKHTNPHTRFMFHKYRFVVVSYSVDLVVECIRYTLHV